jgi:type I restriction enzyme M protein
VIDPACGSGSLLLKVASEAKPVNISIYGQEKDNPTAALAILNMWLHGEPTAVIKKGQSTLSNPLFTDNGALKTFDYVVANPPFSDKKWRFGFEPENDSYGRFDGFGIPPTKNGDYAFLLHIIKSLKSTGKGACVLPHGVLFRGNAEAEIRTNLIKRGYIKAIIGLPANLFYGTGIPACILVLDKEKASERQGIFMIDASKGFVKDGNKNRLREQDIRKIIDVWTDQVETPKFSHFAGNEEIEKKEYNLNLPRYIDTSDLEDSQDIEAHLKGGIPKNDIDNLQNFWDICPNLRAILFKNSDRSGYFDMAISADDVRKTIFDHAEFSHFKNSIQVIFEDWREIKTTFLKSLDKTTHPKTVIAKLSNGLLARFADIHLIDKYDVYQHLMNCWEEVMQDDAHIITTDEWQAGNEVIRLQKEGQGKNKGKKKDVAGLEGLDGRLIPTSLIIKTYFKAEQDTLDVLQSELEQVGSEMEEMAEEYAGDGDNAPLEEAKNDAGNITKASLTKQIKEIKNNPEYKEDLIILQKYNDLIKKEADCKAEIKTAENELEKKVIAKYPTLSLDEIKTLVVERKWMDELQNRIMSEVERTSQTLAGRIKELAERYNETLPEIEKETKTLTAKVSEHLAQMGFKI